MLNNSKRNQETFNDGIMEIVKIKNRSIQETVLSHLRFGNKTVGVTRFYESKVAGSKIDKLVSVPFNPILKKSHKIIIDEKVYDIIQLQEKMDTLPATELLTLQLSPITYEDARTS